MELFLGLQRGFNDGSVGGEAHGIGRTSVLYVVPLFDYEAMPVIILGMASRPERKRSLMSELL